MEIIYHKDAEEAENYYVNGEAPVYELGIIGDYEGIVFSDYDNPHSINHGTKRMAATATVTAEPATEDTGAVYGGGIFAINTEATLFAVPAEGYIFSAWSDEETENPRTITVTEDIELTAEFTEEPEEE